MGDPLFLSPPSPPPLPPLFSGLFLVEMEICDMSSSYLHDYGIWTCVKFTVRYNRVRQQAGKLMCVVLSCGNGGFQRKQ